MQKNKDQFEACGVDIIIVSFSEGLKLQEYIEYYKWIFPIYSDAERKIYKLFGLGRARKTQIFTFGVIWKYLKLIAQGKKLKKTNEDVYQLGGDFMIDGKGILQYCFESENPDDRPSIEELLKTAKNYLQSV
ncbi:MAG: AhpC/TSA family protein [Deltaproteobacteria bacterium]|nr:AhpC/TSA family protein [Deltaproteobacteria bacterium]